MSGSRCLKKSLVTDDMDRCYICGSVKDIEMHHIFGGPDRKISDKYGLIIPLCHRCHNEPPDGAHFSEQTARWLHEVGQRTFEMEGHSREEFLEVFKRGSYL